MGHSCNNLWRESECIQNLGQKNLKIRELLQEVRVDERTILKWIFKKFCKRMWAGQITFRVESNGEII
jgi:hypothetical protein